MKEASGIHKNLCEVIQESINQSVNESHERVAAQEGIRVEDVRTICKISKENAVRWKYIRMLKEGRTIESIVKYDTEKSMSQLLSVYNMLGSYGKGYI